MLTVSRTWQIQLIFRLVLLQLLNLRALFCIVVYEYFNLYVFFLQFFAPIKIVLLVFVRNWLHIPVSTHFWRKKIYGCFSDLLDKSLRLNICTDKFGGEFLNKLRRVSNFDIHCFCRFCWRFLKNLKRSMIF